VPYIPTVFQRLLEPLDRRVVSRIVEAHDGNWGVGNGARAWTCQRHLKTLLFGQLAGLSSLRDLVEALSAHPEVAYHCDLRLPKRSTLADASAARPAAVFRDLAAHVMAGAARTVRREAQDLIRLLDATPIELRDQRLTWAEADARTRGLKLLVLYDPTAARPLGFDLVSPKVSDIRAGRAVALEPGATYVFDKGFTDYGWWQQIVEAKAIFVTRLKVNACRRESCEQVAQGDGILADRTLKIGHQRPRGGAVNPLWDTVLREVVVARDGKPPLHFITNDLKRSAADIAALYKQRWAIELFFKWLKQYLKITSFLGRSENAVRIQVYVALIAFVLLHLFKLAYAGRYPHGAKALLARLRFALFDRLDFTNRAKPPPGPPGMRPTGPQLRLALPC